LLTTLAKNPSLSAEVEFGKLGPQDPIKMVERRAGCGASGSRPTQNARGPRLGSCRRPRRWRRLRSRDAKNGAGAKLNWSFGQHWPRNHAYKPAGHKHWPRNYSYKPVGHKRRPPPRPPAAADPPHKGEG